MKALYCYFGRFYDHSADIPGHPLYQLFFLHSLVKTFGIKKLYVMYYPSPYTFGPVKYSVLKKLRQSLKKKIIFKEVDFDEAMKKTYDLVFLKHRFRNYSRLRDGSLDRFYYEKLLSHFTDAFVIDTDGEVENDSILPSNIITFYTKYTYRWARRVRIVVPVLKEDILSAIDIFEKEPNLTFIGNEYFKDGLHSVLCDLTLFIPNLKIIVQGKWQTYSYISKIIDRTNRELGYKTLQRSICSIHISKSKYLEYGFLSPRIFESYLLSTLIFSKDEFMPKFSQFKDIIELSEKIKFLFEISPTAYLSILKKEIEEFYGKLDKLSIS